ncbi:unnamed protein product [Staurois parvus]|uniref:Uncharacterized protein n=1 Tax=Staurois parvus TaxID=386267 RepID=A0ABN9C8E8_9NEOB|nr:unnamed protein product [Staurois parvus]
MPNMNQMRNLMHAG